MVTKKSTSKTKDKEGTKKSEKINIEKEIIEIGKKGHSTDRIGLILKQEHKIHNIKKATGKKISQILNEAKISYEKPMDTINKKISKLEGHFNKNKQDKVAKKSLLKAKTRKNVIKKYERRKKRGENAKSS